MSILKLLIYPDKRLRKKAFCVKKINQDIINLVKNMLNTMYYYNGIGLSATQVNVNKKIVVIDISENKNNPYIFINPVFIKKKKVYIPSLEGCLSIPNFQAKIFRFSEVEVKAFNILGKSFKLYAKKLFSICLQHEMDHLIGKLFIDYLSDFETN